MIVLNHCVERFNMMVSLRWVIFIIFGLTFLFFFRILAILKKKAGGKRPFLNFCHPGNSKKNKKQSGCFFYFFEFRESSKRKLVGRCLFFLFFFLPSRKFQKKQKKTASCFWDFFQFLNFGNPQKESWWEESFFLIF